MHEQLHTSDPDLLRLEQKYQRLTPENQALFMAYLEDLLENPDTPLPAQPLSDHATDQP